MDMEAPRGMGFLGRGVPLSSRLGDLGERRELPSGVRGLPGRQRILGIFQGLLVETMHYEVWYCNFVMCENY